MTVEGTARVSGEDANNGYMDVAPPPSDGGYVDVEGN
jgi:hypothetical protein